MPLTTSGELKIVAISDLGGLGAKEGAPITYNLVLPSPVPALLPWLGILFLLALKPNRSAPAWWILAPLGLLTLIAESALPALSSVPGELLDLVIALVFGIAGVWLLSPHLRRKHRFLTFLLCLLALAGCSGLSFAVKQGFRFDRGEEVAVGLALLMFAPALAVALSLAGLFCRTRYSRLRLSLWLMGLCLAISLLVVAPFFVAALVLGQGAPGLPELFLVVSVLAAIGFGVLLPFLLLSFSNAFYHERLKNLLHVPATSPPPVMAPPIPALGEKVMNP